jgi:hypothetical protein
MCSKPSAAMTCVFDVQQNSRPISEEQHCAARPAARCAACSALHAFLMSFSLSNLFFDLSTQKRRQRCVQRDVAFVQHHMALHGLLPCLLHSVELVAHFAAHKKRM